MRAAGLRARRSYTMQRTSTMVAKGKFVAFLSLVGVVAGAALAADLGTAFTYQGQLNLGWDAVQHGPRTCVSSCMTVRTRVRWWCCTRTPNVPPWERRRILVMKGLFTEEIDFGQNVFTGKARGCRSTRAARPVAAVAGRKLTPAPTAWHCQGCIRSKTRPARTSSGATPATRWTRTWLAPRSPAAANAGAANTSTTSTGRSAEGRQRGG